MSFDTEGVAAAILDDRRARRRFVAFSSTFDIASVERAYRVQSALVSKLAARESASIIGYKIGLLPKGVEPPAVSGAILSSRRIRGFAKLSDRVHLAVEPEVCIWIGRDIATRDRPYSADEIASAIEGAGPAFELTDDRFADFGHFDARSMIADNAWTSAVVLGPVAPLPRMMRCSARFRANASPREMHDPDVDLAPKVDLVRWLAHQLHERGEMLRAGQIVMTGSLFPPYYPVSPQTVIFEIEGIGSVSLRCEA